MIEPGACARTLRRLQDPGSHLARVCLSQARMLQQSQFAQVDNMLSTAAAGCVPTSGGKALLPLVQRVRPVLVHSLQSTVLNVLSGMRRPPLTARCP